MVHAVQINTANALNSLEDKPAAMPHQYLTGCNCRECERTALLLLLKSHNNTDMSCFSLGELRALVGLKGAVAVGFFTDWPGEIDQLAESLTK